MNYMPGAVISKPVCAKPCAGRAGSGSVQRSAPKQPPPATPQLLLYCNNGESKGHLPPTRPPHSNTIYPSSPRRSTNKLHTAIIPKTTKTKHASTHVRTTKETTRRADDDDQKGCLMPRHPHHSTTAATPNRAAVLTATPRSKTTPPRPSTPLHHRDHDYKPTMRSRIVPVTAVVKEKTTTRHADDAHHASCRRRAVPTTLCRRRCADDDTDQKGGFPAHASTLLQHRHHCKQPP